MVNEAQCKLNIIGVHFKLDAQVHSSYGQATRIIALEKQTRRNQNCKLATFF